MTVPSCCEKALMWTCWGVFNLYVWFLPQWSYYFSHTLGYWKTCSTPANEIQCVNGDNYTQIAVEQERWINGSLVGCACGENVLPDGYVTCVSSGTSWGFSVSYFCETSFGIGGTAATTTFPFIFLWRNSISMNDEVAFSLLRQANTDNFARKFNLIGLAIFHIFFLVYQMLPLCIFPDLHHKVTTVFTVGCVIHGVSLSFLLGDLKGPIAAWSYAIVNGVATAILCLFMFTTWPQHLKFLSYWAFFYAECFWLSVTFLAPPLLTTLMLVDYSKPLATQE